MVDVTKESLHLLIVFEAIFETQSVSKASERLGISQPSLSYTLARMRATFDDPMFLRVKNVMVPTPRALAISGLVKQTLETMRRDIFQPQSFDPSTSTRLFTLCMTDVAEIHLMPRIVKSIQQVAPLVRLRTVTPISERLENGLESGAVDLAVGYFPDMKKPNIYTQRLHRSGGFVCIAGAGNRYVGAAGLTLGAFAQAPHVAIRTEGRSQEVIEQAMKKLGISRHIVLSIPNFLGLLTIIPETDLISTVATDLTPAFEQQSGIAIHPLPFKTPTVDVVLVWHQRYHKDAANRWLRELVRTCRGGSDAPAVA